MKNKILIAGLLAMTLIFVCNAYAVSQNSSNATGTGNQGQQPTQQQGQDENETDNQVQNENQINNQGESSQIQNTEQEGTQNGNIPGSAVAVQRRSNVANAVQEMLKVAENNSGIGQQVRTIAQTQTQNQEKLEECLEKIQSRSGFANFMIGADYSEINNGKAMLAQNREQIEQLNQVIDQLANQDDAENLTQQIQILEQANLEIEDSLETAQKGFSLFGWLFRLFSS